MTPVTFFFIGMMLIYAVTSGKALAIWNAVTGSVTNTANPSSQSPIVTPGFDQPKTVT